MLPVACAACGFANEAGARFCGGCGTALRAPAQADLAPLPAEAERRPVSVLFADLCGYTRLSEQLDAEDVHRLLQAFFAAADAVVAQSGGRVDKHIGDAVMAIYGAPVAHGDEPLRAVQAARAIVEAVPRAGIDLGRSVCVHVGIAAGEVVASDVGSGHHSTYTVIGPSVNLAARLTEIAGPGEIVIDDAVHAEIAASAQCVALQNLAIKGVDRPVTAWRVVALDTSAQRHPIEPLAGRRSELAQLAAALHACRTARTGGVVYVRGDAGIGKTRLTSEALAAAQRDGFAVHRALVLDSGIARDRDAVRALMAGLLDLSPGSASGARAAALERAVARHWIGDEQAPFIADLLDVPLAPQARALFEATAPVARQRATIAAMIRLLEAASDVAPRVLAIEDLHWADASTLARVADLARAATRMPVLLILTSRLDGDPLAGAWRAALRGGSLTCLDLGPLCDSDAAQLARNIAPTANGLTRRCIERAGGNPLFLEQLMRAGHEQHDRLPPSLHSLVLARVDRLPQRDRAALRAASVVGQRFPLALLRVLCATADYTCDTLLDHRLVQQDGEDYLFSHALIRDGVYASLTRVRRAELHRQAAQWYRTRDRALHAEHLASAEAPEAARAYREAAEAEAAALRPERALALADRGVALARAPDDMCALQLLRSTLLRDIGDGGQAADAARAALDAAQAPLERCQAMLGIAAGRRLTGEVEAALAPLAEAEMLARTAEGARELMEIHWLRGNVQFARSRIEDCRAEHRRAYERARALGDTQYEARALSGLGDADYAQGAIRAAYDRFVACLGLCDTHGYTRIAVPNRVMLGHCRIYLADFEAGREDMRLAAEMAVRIGNRHAEMFALQSTGMLLSACGRGNEAEASLARARDLARTLGARRYLAMILAHQTEPMIAQARLDEARALLRDALAMARETGIGFGGPLILGLLVRVSEDVPERAAFAREAERILDAGCFSHCHFLYRRLAIDDALARGEHDEALRQGAALERYTAAQALPYSDMLVRRACAWVAVERDPQNAQAWSQIASLRAQADALHWSMSWPTQGVATVGH